MKVSSDLVRLPVLYLAFTIFLAPGVMAADAVAPPAGVVQVVLPAHSSAILTIPFQPFPSVSSLDALLADQLTASANPAAADRVLVWNEETGQYRTAAKLLLRDATGEKTCWMELRTSDAGEETVVGPACEEFRIDPGRGFVIQNRQDREAKVYLKGSLILDLSRSVRVPVGLSLKGFPYTTAKPASDTSIGEFGTVLATNAFRIGEGYWLDSRRTFEWQEVRPYANPFSASNAAVRISDLNVAGNEVTLKIAVADPTVEAIDLLVRDIAATDVVCDWRGWKLAASTLPIEGGKPFTWTDETLGTDPAFKGVRLYLVTRSDTGAQDLDADGVPDARQWFCGTATDGSSTVASVVGTVATGGMSSPAMNSVDGTRDASLALTNETVSSENPLRWGGVIYIDIVRGHDSFSGTKADVVTRDRGASTNMSTTVDGPKRTIREGIGTLCQGEAMAQGGTLVIHPGLYGEHLNVAGRPIHVEIRGNVDISGNYASTRLSTTSPSNDPLSEVELIGTNNLPATCLEDRP